MMGNKEMEEFGEFWLPADFLSDDFFVEKGASPVESVGESESEEESVAGLSQQMGSLGLNPKAALMATSPQSTLCGIGSWSFSSNGSPEGGTSRLSSPPSTPFPPPQGDHALDLLYAAAGQVARLEMNDESVHQHDAPLFRKNKKTGHQWNQAAAIIQQQLQAARFYELKRQQLMKRQWLAARHREEMGSLGLSNSAWPPLQKHHHPQVGPPHEMRPAFLNGARRESKGTGVFLPRRAQPQPEPRKKPAFSPVVLPPGVVQALNLNLDDVTVHPRVPGAYFLDQETLLTRGSTMRLQENRSPRRAVAAALHLRLPTEWTY